MFWRKEAPSLESRVAMAFFETCPDGMMWAKDAVFKACNPACERILGRRADQIIGHSPVDFAAPFQSDGRPSAQHVAEHVEQVRRVGMARFEWLNLDGQGNLIRCLITLLPVHIEEEGELLVMLQPLAETAMVIDDLRHGLADLSQGNLSCHLTRPFREDYEGLRASFNNTVDAFADSMGKVLETADLVANGAREIERAAQDLSLRGDQQSAKVEATVAALHQISEAITQSADAVTQANALVAQTRRRAEESGAVVARAVEAMGGIETSSHEISAIVSVIDGIAFQTNLLALNAGVEAARAGDAGRGFAVVASEVRALAQRSADAAKDIKARIEGSTQQVAGGVALVTETGSALSRIARGVAEVSEVMDRIAQDTNRHASQLRQANITVGEMDQITQSNAALSEQASTAARGLTAQSGALMQELGRFRVGRLADQTAGFRREPLRAA